MNVIDNYPPRPKPTIIAIISFAYFVLAVTTLYFLDPAYSLMNSFTGNYDLASYEFLIATTFFSLGLGSLALGFGLFYGMTRSACSWAGFLLLCIWGVGMVVAGVFPANEGGSTVPHMTTALIAGIFPVEVEAHPETAFSFIHILALILSLPILSLGMILLSRGFKQDQNWVPIHSISSILAVLMCITLILFFPIILFPSLSRYTSFNPLVFVMIGFVTCILWLLMVTARLRSLFTMHVSK